MHDCLSIVFTMLWNIEGNEFYFFCLSESLSTVWGLWCQADMWEYRTYSFHSDFHLKWFSHIKQLIIFVWTFAVHVLMLNQTGTGIALTSYHPTGGFSIKTWWIKDSMMAYRSSICGMSPCISLSFCSSMDHQSFRLKCPKRKNVSSPPLSAAAQNDYKHVEFLPLVRQHIIGITRPLTPWMIELWPQIFKCVLFRTWLVLRLQPSFHPIWTWRSWLMLVVV